MRVKTEKGIKDVQLLSVTPENFIVPEKEKHLYHAIIEVKKFNAETGERLSKPRYQVFGKKSFDDFILHNLKKQGYTVTVLHDPTEYIKETRLAMEKRTAPATTFSSEDEKEKFRQQVIAETTEKVIAELKAEFEAKFSPVADVSNESGTNAPETGENAGKTKNKKNKVDLPETGETTEK